MSKQHGGVVVVFGEDIYLTIYVFIFLVGCVCSINENDLVHVYHLKKLSANAMVCSGGVVL